MYCGCYPTCGMVQIPEVIRELAFSKQLKKIIIKSEHFGACSFLLFLIITHLYNFSQPYRMRYNAPYPQSLLSGMISIISSALQSNNWHKSSTVCVLIP